MDNNTNLNGTRFALVAVLMALVTGLLLVGIAMPTAADDHSNNTGNNSNGTDGGGTTPGDNGEGDGPETCEADIDQFDVQTADSIVNGLDDPARVGVTAVTSITNECPVVVQITFNIPNDMYYQGTSASSSGQGLQTEVFEVNPGAAASFTSTMYSNQPGDRTVTADVEYFPEGQPEDARSIDNLMLTFDVQDPVPEEEWPDPNDAGGPSPEDGDPDDTSDSDGGTPDDSGNEDGGSSDESSDDDGGDKPDGPDEPIANNIVAILAILTIGAVALVLARKGLTVLKT
jgi:hypothetical protein